MTCEHAREISHRILDEELMDAAVRQEHTQHLEGCPLCRDHADEVRRVQQVLRTLPAVSMTGQALDEVRKRTIDARPKRRIPRYWQWTAAAAMFGVAILGSWLWTQQRPVEPTPDQLARAADEVRLVFDLTSRALRKAEQVGIRDVLSDEVAPALRKLPLGWPAAPSADRREPEDDV